MPRFEPFTGVRYDTARVALDDVVAPPYDVIDARERAVLAARSPYNAVHVDLARDEDGRDRYQMAACRFQEWLHDGVLALDPEPAFYVYKMGYHDGAGTPRQTAGVVGALGLVAPGEGDVLPHERTMSRPKGDRLALLRACRANLSPIWGLSLARGLSALLDVTGPPVARCTDDDGVHHRLWAVTEPARLAAVAETAASAPVVIADGHHRYETALAWQQEVRKSTGDGAGDADSVMTMLVELSDEQLAVGPIHRMLSGLPPSFDPVAALSEEAELVATGRPGPELVGGMAAADGFAVLQRERAWLGRPRREPGADGSAGQPDAVHLDRVLAGWPPHTTAYSHRAVDVLAAVDGGEADVGVLLRPATVTQIAHTARANERMPPKTTFFWPKPRTGVLFRILAPPPDTGRR